MKTHCLVGFLAIMVTPNQHERLYGSRDELTFRSIIQRAKNMVAERTGRQRESGEAPTHESNRRSHSAAICTEDKIKNRHRHHYYHHHCSFPRHKHRQQGDIEKLESKKAVGGFEADGPMVHSGSLNPSTHPSKADHPTSPYQTSKPKVSLKQIHPAVISSLALTVLVVIASKKGIERQIAPKSNVKIAEKEDIR